MKIIGILITAEAMIFSPEAVGENKNQEPAIEKKPIASQIERAKKKPKFDVEAVVSMNLDDLKTLMVGKPPQQIFGTLAKGLNVLKNNRLALRHEEGLINRWIFKNNVKKGSPAWNEKKAKIKTLRERSKIIETRISSIEAIRKAVTSAHAKQKTKQKDRE